MNQIGWCLTTIVINFTVVLLCLFAPVPTVLRVAIGGSNAVMAIFYGVDLGRLIEKGTNEKGERI